MVFRVRHSPVVTQHGHHNKTDPSLCQEAQLVGLSPGPDWGATRPSADLAATQLQCSPSWHTPSLKVVPKGKKGQGLAFGVFTTALTGTEANLGLRQTPWLSQQNSQKGDVLQALRTSQFCSCVNVGTGLRSNFYLHVSLNTGFSIFFMQKQA